MLIIAVAKSNGPEVASQDALASLPGVFIANAKIPLNNGRTREVDGVVLSPSGIFVIEAKGFVKGAPARGELDIPFNGPWSISGQPAQFHGKDMPSTQARQSAQTLAGFLRENTGVKQFVSGAVSITAPGATMARGPVLIGDVAVCLDHDLLRGLSMLRQGSLSPTTAAEVVASLRLAPSLVPHHAAIEAEWAKATTRTRAAWPGPQTGGDIRSGRSVYVPQPVRDTAVAGPEAATSTSFGARGYLRLLVAAALIAGLALFALNRLGPEVDEAEDAFRNVVAEEFPKAQPDWDTVQCREIGYGEFFCKVDETSKAKNPRRLSADLRNNDKLGGVEFFVNNAEAEPLD